MTKLTAEQRDALDRHNGPVPVEDEESRQVYYLVDGTPLDSLRQDADLAAIQKGIADMEAGRVLSLDELDPRIQALLRVRNS